MNLIVDVFCHTESTELMSSVGLDFDWDTLETKKVFFKNIDLAMPITINNKDYSEIHVGGNYYIAKIHYIDLLKTLYEKE